MSADDALPQLFTEALGVMYAINELPVGKGVVPLTICAGSSSTLKLHYEPGMNALGVVLLVDVESGKSVNLCEEDVEIKVESGEVLKGRYYISFVDGATAIDTIETLHNIKPDAMRVYDIQGRQMNTTRKNNIYIRGGIKYLENKP